MSNVARSACLGNKAPNDLALGPPVFLETDGGLGGDIFDSQGNGQVATERAVVHLNSREEPYLRKMDKELLRGVFTDAISAMGVPAIPKYRKKRKWG